MVEFNSNLNNLFKNYQLQQQYKKQKFDVNGDGKINSKDKSALTKEEKTIKKAEYLYDVNSDFKYNQIDVDMFVKGDVNSDGNTSKEESNFITAYKKDFTTSLKKQKTDFELDGKKYVNGKLATGVYNGKYYKNGVLGTGTVNGKRYEKGIIANGIISGYLYKDGVKFTGIASDGKYYKNGKVFTGTLNGKRYEKGIIANGIVSGYLYKDGVKVNGLADDGKYYKSGKVYTGTIDGTYYKKGVFQYSVIDNNGKDYPNLSSGAIKFKNGKKYVKVKLEIGEKAVINSNGTVNITTKDNKSIKNYDKTGQLTSTTNVTPTVQPTATPTVTPTVTPTITPTVEPTVQPTVQPTVEPTVQPTVEPTIQPTVEPTVTPTVEPPVTPVGTEYTLSKDLKSITVNGKEVKIDVGLTDSQQSGKIIVEDSGKINIYAGTVFSVKFDTTEDLNIEIKECKNKDFNLYSGSGNDNIVVDDGVVMYTVDGAKGNNTLINNGEVMYLGQDHYSYDGNNTLTNNGIVNQHIYGSNGDDTITNNGTVKGHLVGGKGNDTITNTETGIIDTINGTDGDNIIVNKGKVDTIDSGHGNDTISNWGDVGTVWGSYGNDTITNEITGIVTNFIAGESGDDTIINRGIIGESRTKTGFIDGGDGNDTIINEGIVSIIKGESVTNSGLAEMINGEPTGYKITDEDYAENKDKALDLRNEMKGKDDVYEKAKGHNILENIWEFLFGWIKEL